MWPALAKALADSRPKPLDAPVMMMTCFMTHILLRLVGSRLALKEWRCRPPRHRPFGSDHAAVGAQYLAVDPGAVGAYEERDRRGDILWRAEPLQRIHLGQAMDQFGPFAVEEKIRRG